MSGEEFVASLMQGRLDVHGQGLVPKAGVSFAPGDDPAAVVANERADVARLRTEFQRDPGEFVARFREFYDDKELTEDDVDQWLAMWEFATEQPDAFERAVKSPQPTFGIGDWFTQFRAYVHVPPVPSQLDKEIIAEVVRKYRMPAQPAINPNLRMFEEPDPGWWPLARAHLIGQRRWPEGLERFPQHDDPGVTSTFCYPCKPECKDPTRPAKVALFSDFGTGLYHSKHIALQLAEWAYPHAFHLGDVYYGGSEKEFESNFAAPLRPLVGAANTELFGLAENHELYARGAHYLTYFQTLRESGRTRQEGPYFCIEFPHHQVIGIDVNWHGRRRFTHPACKAWLADRLAAANGRSNVLLSGNAPYCYGEPGARMLLDDLREFVASGQIHLWFWGDDHYCALFDRELPDLPFIGSCIGHGGFPGAVIRPGQPCFAPVLWAEYQARFPRWTRLRQDRSNNGWVEMTLRTDKGVDLLYVDWLKAKRLSVRFDRTPDGLVATDLHEFPGREAADEMPALHLP